MLRLSAGAAACLWLASRGRLHIDSCAFTQPCLPDLAVSAASCMFAWMPGLPRRAPRLGLNVRVHHGLASRCTHEHRGATLIQPFPHSYDPIDPKQTQSHHPGQPAAAWQRRRPSERGSSNETLTASMVHWM